MPAAFEVYSARRACTSTSAWAGLAPVPEPAVSSFAVMSVVLRRLRSSSAVRENMVWNVSRSMSSTSSAGPCRPSALRTRESTSSLSGSDAGSDAGAPDSAPEAGAGTGAPSSGNASPSSGRGAKNSEPARSALRGL